MIEAMLAFTILTMVLTGIYSLVSRSMISERRALTRYEATAMARAVLDEYVVTYPEMARTGRYGDKWHWVIEESSASGLMLAETDRYFRFLKITVVVTEVDSEQAPVELSTILARRAQ